MNDRTRTTDYRSDVPRQTSPSTSQVPPHRRKSNYDSYMDDDKKRLRELKVDEEFDKLKKELGY